MAKQHGESENINLAAIAINGGSYQYLYGAKNVSA